MTKKRHVEPDGEDADGAQVTASGLSTKPRKARKHPEPAVVEADTELDVARETTAEAHPKKKKKKRHHETVQPTVPATADEAEEGEVEATTATTEQEEGELRELQNASATATTMTATAKADTKAELTERQKRRKERKTIKKAARRQAETPTIAITDVVREDSPLKIKDIRDLVLWAMADGVNTPWMTVKHKHNIHHMVVVMVNGLHKELLEEHGDVLPHLMPPTDEDAGDVRCFQIGPVVTMAPGTNNRIHSSLQCLLQIPLSSTQKRKREELKADPEYQAAKQRPVLFSGKRVLQPEELILSLDVMRENNYYLLADRDKHLEETRNFVAVPGAAGADAFVPFVKPTRALSGEVRPEDQLLAIDCEMCRTVNGLELTRISVVNEHQQVLYDSFVLPHAAIIDYNTRWSGITAATLLNVRTRLEHVQEKLMELLTPNTILVGHSLENDLKAMKLFHDRVIDTALVYEHPRGPPAKPSLRYLSEKHLHRVIQDSEKGHDSIEDARAAMQLVLLKLEKGVYLADELEDIDLLFRRLAKQNRKSAYVDSPHSTRVNARPPTVACPATSDEHAIEQMKTLVPEHNFVFGRLAELETYQKTLEKTDDEVDRDRIREILANLDRHLSGLTKSLPPSTFVVLVSGHGDMREARKLIGQQQPNDPEATSAAAASTTSTQLLEAAIKRGRTTVSFFTITQSTAPASAAFEDGEDGPAEDEEVD